MIAAAPPRIPHVVLAIASFATACFTPSVADDDGASSSSTSSPGTGPTSVASTSDEGTSQASVTSIDPDDGSTSSSATSTTVDPSTTEDTGTTTGTPPSCNDDPSMGFTAPIPLPGINTASNELNAWLSADELVLWLSSDRPGGAGGYDVHRSTRADPTGAFGPSSPLVEINTAANELVHSLSSDTLVLYGASDGPGSLGALDVMVATRPSTLAAFSPLAPLANINSSSGDAEGNISADGTQLYFSTNRMSGWDIYRATLDASGSFGAPSSVDELNVPGPGGAAGDGNAVLSADGLSIYFASTRDDPSWDVYVATRPSTQASWGAPINVVDVNSGATDLPLWVSSDGCRLLLTSTRPGQGGYDLWIAEREP